MTDARIATLFSELWRAYAAVTPQAPRIHALLEARGQSVRNDHVAFRTFDVDPIGLDALCEPFEALGYVRTGAYVFEQKRLDAVSLSHPSGRHPRVFISALRTSDFPAFVADTARTLAAQVALRGAAVLTAAPTWAPVTRATYERLAEISEYAAWLAAFGIRANHFTVSVDALEGFEDVASVNRLLTAEGFALNTSGGAIKGGPDVLLAQSSTLASRVPWAFSDGEQTIPSCYYEFAQRFDDPATGQPFDGFVTGSADKIFESTDRQPHTG